MREPIRRRNPGGAGAKRYVGGPIADRHYLQGTRAYLVCPGFYPVLAALRSGVEHGDRLPGYLMLRHESFRNRLDSDS